MMKSLLTLAAAATLPLASALKIGFYSDNACTVSASTPILVYSNLCTATPIMSVLGTSACSSTSVTVTHYRNANMAMTCTGTPAWTATITSTGCTPISDSVLGNIFAKILGGTCTPAGPVYTTNLYPNANGACTGMFSSWSMVASGICYDASFQNAYAAQLNLTGTNTANIYLGTPGGTVCSNTPTYANVNTQGTCFNMSAVLGSGGFNLMPAAAYTSGVASVMTSLAAGLVAVLAVAVSMLA